MFRASVRRLAAACVVLAALAGLALVSRAYDTARMNAAAAALGPRAQAGARDVQALVARIRPLDVARQLAEVNAFFNARIAYATDTEVWGMANYFASPLETLNQGRGDCEDYAGSKLFTLLAAGVPASRLSLAYVQLSSAAASSRRAAAPEEHMVLVYFPPGVATDPLVLDNVEPAIRPASQRPDLRPVYFLDARAPGAGAAPLPVIRDGEYKPVDKYYSPWTELLIKARSEGFF